MINHLKECESAEGQASNMQIDQKAKMLIQQRHKFSERWFSVYSIIEKNERVDKLAKNAAIEERVKIVK